MKQCWGQPKQPLVLVDLILHYMPYGIRDHQLTHLPMLGIRQKSKQGEGGRLWKAYKDTRSLGRCKPRWTVSLHKYGRKRQLLCLRFYKRFLDIMGVPPNDTKWAWDQTLLLEDAPLLLHLTLILLKWCVCFLQMATSKFQGRMSV